MQKSIECPHCHMERTVRLEGQGGACGFYDEDDGRCPGCGKWHDEEAVEAEELV